MTASLPNVIALVLLLGITAYSTAGGVDFGAGIWDLLAGNSPTGQLLSAATIATCPPASSSSTCPKPNGSARAVACR